MATYDGTGLSRREMTGLAAAALLAPAELVAATVPASPRLSEEAFRRLAVRVSNWGRWGSDDRLGALNMISPETIRAASALIRTGERVACGWPVPSLQPGTVDTSGRLDLRVSAADSWGAVNDTVTLDVHGKATLTHLDALGHIYYRGQHYNGRPFTGVSHDQTSALGIEDAREGIVGRGVLIDLAAAMNKLWLDAADRLTPEDLRRAIAASGETLRPGDILFFNTGYAEQHRALGKPPGIGAPTGGLQIECIELLHASQPALFVSDLGMDTAPSEVASVKIPWHVLAIVMMGVRLVDYARLDALVATARRLRRNSFFCCIAPVDYTGATSSPVNPLCLF